MTLPSARRTLLGTALTIAAAAAALVAPASAVAAVAAVAAGAHYTGVVRSPDGKPVPGVYVSDDNDLGLSGTTNAKGRFDFDPHGITATIYLCARLTQDAPQGGAAGWYDACQYVDPGVEATVTLQPGAAVGGVVIDVKSGRPLAGASVGVWDNNQSYAYTVTTDAHGYYHYRNLRPTTTLRPHDADKVTAAAPNGFAATDAVPEQVTLHAGQARNDLGIQVAPVVVYRGTVVDGSGAPVRGARVGVQTYDEFQQPLTTVQTSTTDARGAWTVRRPWSGVADICTWAEAATTHPTGLALTCVVHRSNGLDARQGLTLSARGGALSGQVYAPGGTDGSERSIAATVAVPLADGSTFLMPAARTRIDAAGNLATLTASGLPPGTYHVRATVGAVRSNAVAVAYSGPLAVAAGATTKFPKITLQVGD